MALGALDNNNFGFDLKLGQIAKCQDTPRDKAYRIKCVGQTAVHKIITRDLLLATCGLLSFLDDHELTIGHVKEC